VPDLPRWERAILRTRYPSVEKMAWAIYSEACT
jgi:hypothetical protein